MQYLARHQGGPNDPVHPVDPVKYVFPIFAGNGRTFSILIPASGWIIYHLVITETASRIGKSAGNEPLFVKVEKLFLS